jgi:hypothetical protein
MSQQVRLYWNESLYIQSHSAQFEANSYPELANYAQEHRPR